MREHRSGSTEQQAAARNQADEFRSHRNLSLRKLNKSACWIAV
jgi:hypothetical protein